MACNYYPPCPEPARVEGAVEHTDPSLFTVLAQDAIGGLQVRINGGDNDGQWVDVPPVPGALLVNVGDVLKVKTHRQNCSSSLL
jgi:isopenicillin N synthase-like dioxygenase